MPQLGQAIRPCAYHYGICFLSKAGPFHPPNARRAARAIDALRRGWPIRIVGNQAELILYAIETTRQAPATAMLLSASRAATLKLVNQRAAANTTLPVMISVPPDLTPPLALAIADPVLDLLYPMKGPFSALPLPDPEAAIAAIEIARLAGLLPAFLVVDKFPDDIDNLSTEDVALFLDAGALQIAARAKLPVSSSEYGEVIAFRSYADSQDHIALIIGERSGSIPVVRLHSECLTGDVLGSLKCDCGPQLHEALHQISEADWGILLYLRQEGRGIGLVNKLRAYALQDQGYDTVDANIRLGFAIDARDFAVAGNMLRLLNVEKVRLLTNNPEKVAGLEGENICVTEQLPLRIPANIHNASYLATKRDRTGHKL